MIALWHHWVSRAQKDQIKRFTQIDDEEVVKLLSFLGAIHDIGKATPVFQTQPGYGSSHDLDVFLIDQLKVAGFTEIERFNQVFRRYSHHALAGQWLLENFGIKEDISSIIGAHHGNPVNHKKDVKEQELSYLYNYFQSEDSNDPIYHLWWKEQKVIFERALKVSGYESIDDLSQIQQPGQVLLSGLLIMADWIASNTSFYPLFNVDGIESAINQDKRVEQALMRWGYEYDWDSEEDTELSRIYEERFGFNTPNKVQKSLFHLINQIDQPGILILEAPTGIGKTEASLVSAEQFASKVGAKGIFFGLPTQATSNGIFPRITEWVNALQSEFGDKRQIRLTHGKSAQNDYFHDLATGIDIENHLENIQVNQWFSGRKTSALDDFVIGTVDQFLQLSLKQKHLALRHLGYSNKVIIIDEVHAYDAYMSQYLHRALTWMGTYKVPVILLSATLPPQQRQDLVLAYLQGYKDLRIPPTYQLARSKQYPLITYTDGKAIKMSDDIPMEKGRTIYIKKISDRETYELIDAQYEEGGIIGMIVNTVKRAQMFAKYFIDKYGESQVELIHSHFIHSERLEREKNILKEIGKKGYRPKKKIYIGTQVLEQSLDIDFDVLFTDLAPIDLLLQRMGRLQRHQRTRLEQYKSPTVYIMGTSKEMVFESGSAYIYGDYLLARTQYFIHKVIQVPQDVPDLIESVYDSTLKIDLSDDLINKYQIIEAEHERQLESKKQKARTFRLDRPKYSKRRINSLIGLTRGSHPNDSEAYGQAQVRDIDGGIEVILLQKIKDGYGFIYDGEDISRNLDESAMAKKVAFQTINLPSILTQPWNIDTTIRNLEKYNLKYLANWQRNLWLKGTLGIVLDEKQEFVIDEVQLRYDRKLGLTYERMGDDESI